MKYYCVLKKIVNFEIFIDTFWQTFKKNLEVLEIFNKICKKLTKIWIFRCTEDS